MALARGLWPAHFRLPRKRESWLEPWLTGANAGVLAGGASSDGSWASQEPTADSLIVLAPAARESDELSLEAFLERSMAIKCAVLDKRSLTGYRATANRLLEFARLGGDHQRPAGEFTSRNAGAFLAWILQSGISAKTHNNYRAMGSAIFSEGQGAGLVPDTFKNPFAATKARKVKGKDRDLLTELERKQITAHLAAEDDRLLMVCELIFYCFIRPVEIARLRIRDIQLERGEIQLVASRAKSRGRVVAIPEVFMSRLHALNMHLLDPDWILFSDAHNLLPGERRMEPSTMAIRMAERFAEVRTVLGIRSQIKLYSFKDTGADVARRAGLDLKEISEQMGHASLNETDHYLRPISGRAGSRFAEKMPKL